MAWTQSDLDALKAAYASGAVHVQYSDRSVTYRSLDELGRAISRVQAELDAAAGNAPVRQFRIYAKDGF